MLSLIIPAYNEGGRIRETLTNYFDFIKKNKLRKDIEIIIVLNDCTDNTEEVIDKFKVKKILLNKKGKGIAVMEGFKQATGEFIGFTDADGSANLKDIYKFFKILSNSDYDGIVGERESSRKFVSSYLFKRLVHLLFDLKIKDTQCAVKIFKNETAKLISNRCKQTGWIFDIDVLLICKNYKKKLLQLPVKWEVKDGSNMSFAQGMKSAWEVIKYSGEMQRFPQLGD